MDGPAAPGLAAYTALVTSLATPLSDPPTSADGDRREITSRELAEEQPADIESGGPSCVPVLERRIRAA